MAQARGDDHGGQGDVVELGNRFAVTGDVAAEHPVEVLEGEPGGFGWQVSRDDGSTVRPTHYGDLSELPILETDAEGEPTMSYAL